MIKKILIVCAVLVFGLCGLNGCQKNGADEPAPSKADYEAQAEKEITADNMDQELENIEKSLSEEIASEE